MPRTIIIFLVLMILKSSAFAENPVKVAGRDIGQGFKKIGKEIGQAFKEGGEKRG